MSLCLKNKNHVFMSKILNKMEIDKEYLVYFTYKIEGAYVTPTFDRKTSLIAYDNGTIIGEYKMDYTKEEVQSGSFIIKPKSDNKPTFKK